MPRVLSDHDFRQQITRGLARILEDLDVVRLYDVGLSRAPDDEALRFAASESRVFLTHDMSTMPQAITTLVDAGEQPPRVVLVPQEMPLGRAIEELAIVLVTATDLDWQTGVIRLPL